MLILCLLVLAGLLLLIFYPEGFANPVESRKLSCKNLETFYSPVDKQPKN